MMKKMIVVFFCVLSLFSLFNFSWGKKSKKKVVLKLGHYAAENHPGNEDAKMFAKNVERRTRGAVEVVTYPNNALGAPPEVLEQNILGAIEMSLPTQGQLAKYSQKFGCVMIPFSFKSYDHADKVLDGKFMKMHLIL